jgi:hypothetical protein
MRAVAGPENSQPDGKRYHILAFARGETEEAASAVAFKGLDARGWIEAETLRSGEITDPDAVPEDLKGAMERALRDGCALVVYDEP